MDDRTSVPFVHVDDSANMVAIFAAQEQLERGTFAAIDAANESNDAIPWLEANAPAGISFAALLHREAGAAIEHTESLVDVAMELTQDAAELAARLLDLGKSHAT